MRILFCRSFAYYLFKQASGGRRQAFELPHGSGRKDDLVHEEIVVPIVVTIKPMRRTSYFTLILLKNPRSSFSSPGK